MSNVPLTLLSPPGNRDLAAVLLRRETGMAPPESRPLIETLDAVSATVLHAAGITDTLAVQILAALWQQPGRITDPEPRPHRSRAAATDREEVFLRELGERVHVIRCARRLTPGGIYRRTGIPIPALQELEAGRAWPSVFFLYRLAQVFEVPLPMLVDPKATPVRVLRLLAGRAA